MNRTKQSFRPMLALAVTTTVLSFFYQPLPVSATKLNAAPLPRRNGEASGKASYDRGEKDFGAAEETVVPTSRFRRRPDYRELEKQQKEDEARKAEEEKKSLEAKQAMTREAYKRHLDQIKEKKQQAVQLNNDAVSFGQQGRWEEAIAAHEKAVEYDSGNKQFRINLSAARTAYGQQKLKEGKTQAAASLLRNALAAAPDNGMAGKLLTQALESMGMDPGDADVRIGLGDQLIASNDYQGAYIEYQQALKIDPSAKTYVKMGDIELIYRRVAEALKWYGQAIVKDPDYAAAHRQLGMLYLAQKDSTKAADSLRKALILDGDDHAAGQALVAIWREQVAKNPLSADYHLGLAGALQLSGDFVGARSEYNKLEAIDPQNPGLVAGRESLKRAYQHATAEKHRKAAETLFGQGLKREALAEISQATMMEPRNARYQFLLGECLEAAGDYKGAHQAYLTCVLIDPEHNQEAAARMKEMQNYKGQGQPMSMMPQQNMAMPMQHAMQRQPVYSQGMPNMRQMQSPGPVTVHPNPNVQAPAPFNGKSMYEGAPVQHQAAPVQQVQQPVHMNPVANTFRQVADQASRAQSQDLQPRIFPADNADNPIADGAPNQDTVNNQSLNQKAAGGAEEANENSAPLSAQMAMVSAAEQQKDHLGAAKILREMLTNNLNNAEIHHRLAVNLMAAGEISQAVTEFRIASALKPGNKVYASDLARALSVNKRSLSHNGVGGGQ
ncbi:tetratricopeptide repeat protein [bacterium]|nr:tetratricopeptide repeat protein [bacterium]